MSLHLDAFAALYARAEDDTFRARYSARCHCGRVRYQVSADPVDAKICHCRVCQRLHGAPMQWAAIFHKRDVRFAAGLEDLRFFNSALNAIGRTLPCKVSCGLCGAHLADEGRTMWLAFPPLFEFGMPLQVPASFRPRCHIFYASRTVEMNDGLPKWAGHSERSARLG